MNAFSLVAIERPKAFPQGLYEQVGEVQARYRVFSLASNAIIGAMIVMVAFASGVQGWSEEYGLWMAVFSFVFLFAVVFTVLFVLRVSYDSRIDNLLERIEAD